MLKRMAWNIHFILTLNEINISNKKTDKITSQFILSVFFKN